jgi:hypothetical protein
MLALLTLATVETENQPSKAAYYILGIVAALWAVTLFAIGMRNEKFPGTAGAQRAVMGASVVLVVAVMASAVLTG